MASRRTGGGVARGLRVGAAGKRASALAARVARCLPGARSGRIRGRGRGAVGRNEADVGVHDRLEGGRKGAGLGDQAPVLVRVPPRGEQVPLHLQCSPDAAAGRRQPQPVIRVCGYGAFQQRARRLLGRRTAARGRGSGRALRRRAPGIAMPSGRARRRAPAGPVRPSPIRWRPDGLRARLGGAGLGAAPPALPASSGQAARRFLGRSWCSAACAWCRPTDGSGRLEFSVGPASPWCCPASPGHSEASMGMT